MHELTTPHDPAEPTPGDQASTGGEAGQADGAPPAAAPATGDAVMEIIAGVEQQFERLRDLQTAQAAEADSLGTRAAELERAEQALREQRQQLASREREVQAVLSEREAREAEHRRCEQELEERRAALAAEHEAHQADLHQRQEELHARQQELEESRRHLEALAQEKESLLAEARTEAERLRHETNEHVEHARQEREALGAQLEDARQQLLQRQMEAEQRDAKVSGLEQQLAGSQQMLEKAGEKLKQFSELLSGQAPQLERGAAAVLALDEHKRRIEQLTRQLAEAGGPADDEQHREQERRIEELSEALRCAREEAREATARAAELERGHHELRSEIERLRQQADAGAPGPGVDELTQEIERLRGAVAEAEAAAADGAAVRERNRQLADEVERLRVRAEEVESAVAATASLEQRNFALREQIDGLQRRIRELEDAPPAPAPAEDAAAVAELEAERGRLQQRIRRLEDQLLGRETEENAEIKQQQAELKEVREMLANSERQMIRKWAKSRGILTTFCLAMVVAVVAVGSWMAADRFYPVQIAASMTVEAEPADGRTPSPEALALWQRWHTSLLYDEAFHASVAERMADRMFEPFATEQSVASLLVRDLAVDSSDPGALTLSLRGHDSTQAEALLGVVVSALKVESRQQQGVRGDGLKTVIRRDEDPEMPGRASAVTIVPVEDQRLTRSLPIFGGSLVVMLALFGFAYSRFVSARRVLEDDGDWFSSGTPEDAAPVADDGSLKELGV